jgi:hypothetical protein
MAGPQFFCERGLARDGNRLLFSNKGGRIVYDSGGQIYPFDLELAVPGFFVYFPRELAEHPIKEREAILELLRAWLLEVGYVPKPVAPVDYSEEDDTCLIARCTLRRMKGRYLCRTHFQSSAAGIPDPEMNHFIPADVNCVWGAASSK